MNNNRKKKIFLGTAISAATLSVAVMTAYAAVVSLAPAADGTYTQWTPSAGATHYTLVDESSCNGKTDYVYTTTTGNRDSYSVSLATIPTGSTITAIEITPCASRHTSGNGSAALDVFYRFDGANSSDAGGYTLTGTTPTQLTTTTFSGLSLTRGTSSTLEIGAVYSSGNKGARVSRMGAKVTYTPPLMPPSGPYGLSGSISSSTLSVILNWGQTSDNEDGFEVERATTPGSFSLLDTTAANITTYEDTTVSSGTYYYRVRAYNAAGYSNYSNTATTTVP